MARAFCWLGAAMSSRIIHQRPKIGTRKGYPSYARGKKWPAWALLAVPFIAVMIPLYQAAKRHVHWGACLLTVVVFEAMMIPIEHNSIVRGHWVYNENRILGPLFWGIPIEEPLIYYLFPPILVILIYECVAAWLTGKLKVDVGGWLRKLARR